MNHAAALFCFQIDLPHAESASSEGNQLLPKGINSIAGNGEKPPYLDWAYSAAFSPAMRPQVKALETVKPM